MCVNARFRTFTVHVSVVPWSVYLLEELQGSSDCRKLYMVKDEM